jgi:CubicO group peptidase (beta-lactamase class C family)
VLKILFVKSTLSIIITLFILTNFLCSCSAQQDHYFNEPSNLTWATSSAEKEGIKQLVIDSIHYEIRDGKYGLVDHFLLIKNGKIIADYHYEHDYESIMKKYDTTNHQYNYDHIDWHPYYNQSELHTLQSVTKSITSLLVGIAYDEGLIQDIHSSILPYFSDFTIDSNDSIKSQISIEDLLLMQSGIQWDEESYNEATNSCVIMESSNDWIQFVLDQPMDNLPGTVFEYNSGVSVLLGKIVSETTGKRIDKWAEEKLFKPLGITNYYWKKTPKGEIDTEGGLYLTPHDLAKIGYLILNMGKWNNEQVISKSWIKKSIEPNDGFYEQIKYGYQWLIPSHENGQAKIIAGNGYGDQYVMMSPEHDIIIVFNGWNHHDVPEKSTWDILQGRIIPSIEK